MAVAMPYFTSKMKLNKPSHELIEGRKFIKWSDDDHLKNYTIVTLSIDPHCFILYWREVYFAFLFILNGILIKKKSIL